MNCKFCKADCCSRGLNRDAAFCAGWVKMTNADRIRSMTDEELAVFLYGLVNEFYSMNHDCLDFNYCKVHSGEVRYDGWLDWLRQEVADDGN